MLLSPTFERLLECGFPRLPRWIRKTSDLIKNPSHFDDGSVPRTEGMTHASGVGSGSTILGDLMITAPSVM